MSVPGVSIVIPNWNGGGKLEKTLASLFAQTRGPDEILVVDNGSTDGSDTAAERAGVDVLRLGRNTGFAHAVNAGCERARHELVAVLNNDVELAPIWLERLAYALAEDNAWFAAGKLYMAARPDTLDGTFDAVCRGGTSWRCGYGRPNGAIWNEPRTIRLPPFTATLFRGELFRRVGGLDELLESYLEDVEFGLRAASEGYTGRYVPEAVAWHQGSATLGRWHPRTVRQIARNQLLIVARHYPESLVRRYGWQIAVAQVLWGLVALRHGAGLAWLQGKIDGLRMFHPSRRSGCEAMASLLASSEMELYNLQRQSGFDLYWRLYFALT